MLPNTGSAPTPGWVYVADTGYDPSKTAINPASGKRSTRYAGAAGTVGGEVLTTRQERAKQLRLRELDSDVSSKEIPIPTKKKAGTFNGRTTQNTRRILASAKRFDNYLSDEEAEVRNAPPQRPLTKATTTDRPRRVSTLQMSETPNTLALSASRDVSMQSAAKDVSDALRPLLESDVPAPPTTDELEALLSAPPLTYNAARSAPSGPNTPPLRLFCDTCGYWGRIRCMLCGARVCGLECKRDHESRCNRFG